MKSSIRALAELVLDNIDVLEADCARRGADIPSLQDPYKAGTEFTLDDPDVQNASTIIIAAAQQLIQTIQNPQVNLLMTAYSVGLLPSLKPGQISNRKYRQRSRVRSAWRRNSIWQIF